MFLVTDTKGAMYWMKSGRGPGKDGRCTVQRASRLPTLAATAIMFSEGEITGAAPADTVFIQRVLVSL